jgi:hypothetical protein
VTIIGWVRCIYLFAVIAGLLAGAPAKALPAGDVVAQVQQLVHTKFFDPGRVADFDAAVATRFC